MRPRSRRPLARSALCLVFAIAAAVSCDQAPKRERTAQTGGDTGDNGGASGTIGAMTGGQAGKAGGAAGAPGGGGNGGGGGVPETTTGGSGGSTGGGGTTGGAGKSGASDGGAADVGGGKGGTGGFDASAGKDVASVGGTGGTSPPGVVTYQDLHPFFMKKCGNGCHEVGFAPAGLYHTLATSYADAKKPAGSCPGLTVGACTIVRIKLGQMPSGAGCSPNPGGGAACVTAPERAMLEAWIAAGLPEK